MKLKEDLDEWELWEKFPQHHLWWNKLYVAEKFGYQCGPGATPIPESKQYVIRPIYNLAGMGIGAEVKFLEKGDRSSVPPGYFWCEYFKGTHYSASYIWNKASWKNIHCWIGINNSSNLTKFLKWVRSDYIPPVSDQLNVLYDAKYLNLEFIDNNIIEVHLRISGNPDGTFESKWNEYIPVWQDTDTSLYKNYTWIDNPFDDWMNDKKNYMTEKRLGYYVR